jgi:hypothetical protein
VLKGEIFGIAQIKFPLNPPLEKGEVKNRINVRNDEVIIV